MFFKVTVIVLIRYKADFLAVFFAGNMQADGLSDLPDLFFFIFSCRHQRAGKLFLGKIVQRVGLVLGIRGGAANSETAIVKFPDPGVMPCGYKISSQPVRGL